MSGIYNPLWIVTCTHACLPKYQLTVLCDPSSDIKPQTAVASHRYAQPPTSVYTVCLLVEGKGFPATLACAHRTPN